MSNGIPVQNQKIAYRVIDGSAVLVNPEDSTLYTLNEVATRIWELSNGQNTLEEIATAICQEFDVDFDTALRDTKQTIESLTAKQLFTLL